MEALLDSLFNSSKSVFENSNVLYYSFSKRHFPTLSATFSTIVEHISYYFSFYSSINSPHKAVKTPVPKAHLFSLLIPNNVKEVLVILVNLLLFFEDEDLNFKWFYLRDRVAIINDKIKNKEIFMLSRLKTLLNLDFIPKLKTVSLLLLKIIYS